MSDDRRGVLRLAAERDVAADLFDAGPRRCACLGVVLRGHLDAASCSRWLRGVKRAKRAWTADFDGAQFSLGRAFYSHLEEDRTRAYFAGAAASDALVEAHLPGLQERMRAIVAGLTGGRVVPRPGFCGPGVHVFPSGGEVAQKGGVIHFDTEGLSRHHLVARRPALSIVAMLQPPVRGGGLRLWDVRYAGRDAATSAELEARRASIRYAPGDVVAFDSYRLHQIRPFSGSIDRISATVHAAEIDPGVWETWF